MVQVNGQREVTAAKVDLSSVLSGTALLKLEEGDVMTMVAEWNSLIPGVFDRSRLYFGGQFLQAE